eukprot:g1844.t1
MAEATSSEPAPRTRTVGPSAAKTADLARAKITNKDCYTVWNEQHMGERNIRGTAADGKSAAEAGDGPAADTPRLLPAGVAVDLSAVVPNLLLGEGPPRWNPFDFQVRSSDVASYAADSGFAAPAQPQDGSDGLAARLQGLRLDLPTRNAAAVSVSEQPDAPAGSVGAVLGVPAPDGEQPAGVGPGQGYAPLQKPVDSAQRSRSQPVTESHDARTVRWRSAVESHQEEWERRRNAAEQSRKQQIEKQKQVVNAALLPCVEAEAPGSGCLSAEEEAEVLESSFLFYHDLLQERQLPSTVETQLREAVDEQLSEMVTSAAGQVGARATMSGTAAAAREIFIGSGGPGLTATGQEERDEEAFRRDLGRKFLSTTKMSVTLDVFGTSWFGAAKIDKDDRADLGACRTTADTASPAPSDGGAGPSPRSSSSTTTATFCASILSVLQKSLREVEELRRRLLDARATGGRIFAAALDASVAAGTSVMPRVLYERWDQGIGERIRHAQQEKQPHDSSRHQSTGGEVGSYSLNRRCCVVPTSGRYRRYYADKLDEAATMDEDDATRAREYWQGMLPSLKLWETNLRRLLASVGADAVAGSGTMAEMTNYEGGDSSSCSSAGRQPYYLIAEGGRVEEEPEDTLRFLTPLRLLQPEKAEPPEMRESVRLVQGTAKKSGERGGDHILGRRPRGDQREPSGSPLRSPSPCNHEWRTGWQLSAGSWNMAAAQEFAHQSHGGNAMSFPATAGRWLPPATQGHDPGIQSQQAVPTGKDPRGCKGKKSSPSSTSGGANAALDHDAGPFLREDATGSDEEELDPIEAPAVAEGYLNENGIARFVEWLKRVRERLDVNLTSASHVLRAKRELFLDEHEMKADTEAYDTCKSWHQRKKDAGLKESCKKAYAMMKAFHKTELSNGEQNRAREICTFVEEKMLEQLRTANEPRMFGPTGGRFQGTHDGSLCSAGNNGAGAASSGSAGSSGSDGAHPQPLTGEILRALDVRAAAEAPEILAEKQGSAQQLGQIEEQANLNAELRELAEVKKGKREATGSGAANPLSGRLVEQHLAQLPVGLPFLFDEAVPLVMGHVVRTEKLYLPLVRLHLLPQVLGSEVGLLKQTKMAMFFKNLVRYLMQWTQQAKEWLDGLAEVVKLVMVDEDLEQDLLEAEREGHLAFVVQEAGAAAAGDVPGDARSGTAQQDEAEIPSSKQKGQKPRNGATAKTSATAAEGGGASLSRLEKLKRIDDQKVLRGLDMSLLRTMGVITPVELAEQLAELAQESQFSASAFGYSIFEKIDRLRLLLIGSGSGSAEVAPDSAAEGEDGQQTLISKRKTSPKNANAALRKATHAIGVAGDRWKVGVYCPECGKKSEAGAVDQMGQFCGTMWRKYMRIDDRHCPLFLACKVKDDIVHCEHTGWKDMPRVKGRS